MKGIFVAFIIVGSVALGAGAVIVGYHVAKGRSDDTYVTNRHDINEEIKNINVDTTTANIELAKATDGKALVVCDEREKVYHEVTVRDGLLSIETIDHRSWYEKYLFNINFRETKVTVYLPEGDYQNLTLDSETGNIDVAKDFTFADVRATNHTGHVKLNAKASGDVFISTSTGYIAINDSTANKITTKSSTGDLTIKNTQVTTDIESSASTGDTYYENVTAKNLTSKTSTGDCKLVNTVLDNHIEIKTSTGAVRFDNSDGESIKVRTSTGSIKGSLLTDKRFECHSDTGSVHTPYGSPDAGLCDIESDTGSIDITVKA